MAIAIHPLAAPLLESTRRMVDALRQEPSDEWRLALARRLVRQLGDEAYPVFLKMLLVLAESEDEPAKQMVADLLAAAAQRMDLPSGQLSAWGGSTSHAGEESAPPYGASMQRARRRLLDPIEYLTAWYCQQTQRPMLDQALYADALHKLIDLFGRNAQLRRVYADKLEADAGNELEGTFTCESRRILIRLAQSWKQAGHTTEQVVKAALHGAAPPEPVPPGWVVHRL